MGHLPGEIAAVVPNLVAFVAGNGEEARRHSLVLNMRRRNHLREKSSRGVVRSIGNGFYRKVSAAVRRPERLAVAIRSPTGLREDGGRKIDGSAGCRDMIDGPVSPEHRWADHQ